MATCCATRRKVTKRRPEVAKPASRPETRAAYQAALAAAESKLRNDPDDVSALFERAALKAALGLDDEAKGAYLALLARDPLHFGALTNLGGLALKDGHRAAALSCYRQAAEHHPTSAPALVNLANLLLEDGEFDEAERRYGEALAVDPSCAEAHQGLAMLLVAQGRQADAEVHWRKGFAGRAILTKPYRGEGEPHRVLLLVSARGGNVPTGLILDDHLFEVHALYAEFEAEALALPAHDVVFNAIGDAELSAEALAGAERAIARTNAPLINAPRAVMATTREENASRLAGLAGVRTPRVVQVPRQRLAGPAAGAYLEALGFRLPVLLRSPGFHTGRHFLRVETVDALPAAAAGLPGDEILAIEPLEARGADGLARKYRVMLIDGALYPLHMAAGSDWKVHYFSSAMTDRADLRAEEARFLANMPGVLGDSGMRALAAIRDRLGLDYAGIDFGIGVAGELLLFEANAAMTIVPPDPDPIWDYRRAAIDRALAAARSLLTSRVRRPAGVRAA